MRTFQPSLKLADLTVDTYRTQDYADDPPTPHISVHSPPHAHHKHSIVCTQKDAIPYLSNGKAYGLELLYNGETRKLHGYLHLPEGEEIGLFDVQIPHGRGQDWYVGVTGACGGLWQKVGLARCDFR